MTISILLHSRESAESTIREILSTQIRRETLIAARDAEIERVKQKHDPAIDDASNSIERSFELLENWADNSPGEFGEARSIAIAGCRLGWRTGQPTVKPKGKVSLKTIVSRLIEVGGEMKARFVREKPELNKEEILAVHRLAQGRDPVLAMLSAEDRDALLIEAKATLKQLGVAISQTESFYLEPDRDGQPDVRLSAEAKEAA